ncbi:hypothetical protein LGH83_02555 [Lichenihabitans sp. PAMC28606]|uniref:hypothetical protein n=1 Tax=Lichenihabitans sp. PAMC28606 TaxID=2880932 RepID=UPI001D0AFCEF|nr:hypothetical protein [Lichenihabitans sp. PAMC28606]UDL95142.1 hypothetical protein LGH83_02555 [Lichenihabitans sp. PAMC28606]
MEAHGALSNAAVKRRSIKFDMIFRRFPKRHPRWSGLLQPGIEPTPMYEIEGINPTHISVRHREDHHVWMFAVGRDRQKRRIITSGISRTDTATDRIASDVVVDALLFASQEARRLDLID